MTDDTSTAAVERLAEIDDNGGTCDFQFLRYAPTLRALAAERDAAVAALQKSQAETAAAYERAAVLADDCVHLTPDPGNAIRRYITTAQRTALDAVLAKAFALGVAQARLSVSRHMDWNPATVRDDILLNIDMSCGVTTTPKGGAE